MMHLLKRQLARCVRPLLALACAGTLLSAAANPLSGERKIVLSNAAGERHVIGQVNFADAGGGRSSFEVRMNDTMQDYFLAMRPFLCLTGNVQRLCWFPVKNEAQIVSTTDLLPLEYALMFMRTRTHDLHVNPFNGLYYRLSVDGERLTGRLYEVDMAPFIAPDILPPEQRQRPLKPADFFDADPGSNWLPVLTIE